MNGPQQAPQRRRVQDVPEEDTSGRRGCIVVGALLGVVIGAIFTFFGLPPLLDHLFGEVTVEAGQTLDGAHQVIRVESVTAGPDETTGDTFEHAVFVRLSVSVDKSWDSKPTDWDLEFEGGTTSGARLGQPTPDAVFQTEPGNTRTLVLRFHPSPTNVGPPRALLLRNPQVRFILPPISK